MPDFGFDQVVAPGLTSRFARGGAQGAQRARDDEELSFGGVVGDIALAPVRGVLGAADSLYGLVDALAFDALPDADLRLLGSSRTLAGGIVEGVATFATGFVGVGLPAVGAASRLFSAGNAARTAARTAAQARLVAVGKTAAAGAIADFAVFEAHEERLSNLLEQFPSLSNPVTEFLAADPDDGEVEGRLKNALEGALVGGFVDLFALGLRGLRAQRRALQEGKSLKAVAREVREAAPPEEIARALDPAPRDPNRPQETIEVGKAPKEEPIPDDPEGLLRELFDDPEAVAAVQRQLEARAPRKEPLAPLPVDPEAVAGVLDARRAARAGIDPKTQPRGMTPEELSDNLLAPNDLNLARFQGPKGIARFVRVVEGLSRTYGAGNLESLSPRSLEEMRLASEAAVSDIVQAGDSRDVLRAAIAKDAGDLRALTTRTQAWETIMLSTSGSVQRSLDAALAEFDPALRKIKLARAFEDVQFFTDLTAGVLSLQADTGRALRAFGIPLRTLTKKLREEGPGIFQRAVDEQADGILRELGGEARALDALRKIRAAMDEGGLAGAAGLGSVVRSVGADHGFNILNEVWINGLLSGARTLTINFVGPVLTSMTRPLERVLGGALIGNADEIASGVRQFTGLFRGTSEAFRVAGQAFRNRRGVLSPKLVRPELRTAGKYAESSAHLRAEINGTRRPGAFSPDILGEAGSPLVRSFARSEFGGAMLRAMDTIIPLPSAAIGSIDEFTKQINFRSVSRDELHRDAMKLGLKDEALAEYVESGMARVIRDGQAETSGRLLREGMELANRKGLRGTAALDDAKAYLQANFDERSKEIIDTALQRADEVTATGGLEKGTLSKKLQDAVVAHPTLRLVVPFIGTPINLLKFAARRVDVLGPGHLAGAKIGLLPMPALERTRNVFLKDMLSGSPARKADAVGRLTLGFGTLGFFYGMTASGKITGRGPDEPNRRAALMNAGWRPYSVRVGDRWISYERLDPFAAIVGVAADLHEYAQWTDTSDQDTVTTLGASAVVALSNQLTQKSYLTGIRNFVEALSAPERRAERFLEQLVGSFVVPSAIASGVDLAGDQNMREVRGILDAIRNRIPGLSAGLEPRRNVLGEPIERTRRLGEDTLGQLTRIWMPVAYSEVSDSVVDQQLAMLNHGFGAPSPTRGGVDLLSYRSTSGQTAFDRWQQLHGDVQVGGRDLRTALRQLVTSRRYQALPAESTPDLESPRVSLVENVIRQYRDRAFDQVLREYSDLRRQYDALGVRRRRAQSGQGLPSLLPGGASLRLPGLVTPGGP
jgi:hypothetical protein